MGRIWVATLARRDHLEPDPAAPIRARQAIRVHYCGEQFENDGSIGSNLLKTVKRVMAGECSRELSVKVFAGQCRLVELGQPRHCRAVRRCRMMALRIARLRQAYGLSEALARVLAGMLYGGGDA